MHASSAAMNINQRMRPVYSKHFQYSLDNTPEQHMPVKIAYTNRTFEHYKNSSNTPKNLVQLASQIVNGRTPE